MAQTSAAVEVSSIGCKVLYAVESVAGTRPTSGYIFIPCITTAPAFDNVPEQIDCSDLGDDITQYLPGRQDPGGDAAFTANITTDFLTAWDTLVTAAATAKAAGKRVWFEYHTPNFAKSFFWSGEPVALGHGGLEQNAVQTVQAHVIPNGGQEWADKSAQSSPSVLAISDSTKTVTVGNTASLSVSTNTTGETAVWGTSDATIATVSSGTVTGVKAGTCIIKVTAGDYEADCVVSVSAGA